MNSPEDADPRSAHAAETALSSPRARRGVGWSGYVQAATGSVRGASGEGTDPMRARGKVRGGRGDAAALLPFSRGRARLFAVLAAIGQRLAGTDGDVVPQRRPWRDLRLVPLAAALWAGSVWSIAGPALGLTWESTALWAFGPAAGIPCLVVAVAHGVAAFPRAVAGRRRPGRTRRRRAVALSILVLASSAAWVAGFATGTVRLDRDTAGPAGALLADGGPTMAVIEIIGEPRRHQATGPFAGTPRYIVDARLLEATRDGLRFEASARVRAVGGESLARLRVGERVQTAARVAGGAKDGTGFLSLAGTPRVVGSAEGITALPAAAREALRIHSSWLPAASAGLIPALAVGDRSVLDLGIEADMRAAGLGHLTAVSGANFAMVLGCVLLALRLARCPRWAVHGGCLLVLLLFVAVVGAEPSVLRAAAMGVVALLALASGRSGVSCSALCTAVLVVLLSDPSLALSLGFLLSVLATLGIALCGPHFAAALSCRLPSWLAVAVAVPLSAQLLCGPVLVLVDPSFHVWSLPANIAVTPLVPWITVASTVALASGVLCPPLAVLATAASGPAAALLAWVAHAFAGLPGASVPWPEGVLGAAMMALVSFLNAGLIFAIADPRWCLALRRRTRGFWPGVRGLARGFDRGKVDG